MKFFQKKSTLKLASLLLTFACITSTVAQAYNDDVLRFEGFINHNSAKLPVCLTVIKNQVNSRGVAAYSGSLRIVQGFVGQAAQTASFSVLGNKTSENGLIFSVFDRNNYSPTDDSLLLRATESKIFGTSWETLEFQEKEAVLYPLNLKQLDDRSNCQY